ncbi:hypothetical protein EHQ47_17160 [Leptospira bourretii]|uniref:nucleotide kinase domain-containing protein n=1 Tax=Leptospira bourretii TaxID=2484962 RepID=UPI001090C51E|nr:nucleotide kinase domain-containing protein [Leptospira bourretii]TGL18564.1 hypothetical protein EHQ47_17160 [Leptospira bourretii]
MKKGISKLYPLIPSIAYDYYWYFAFERQNIYIKKLQNAPQPWTEDEILQKYKFTNAYRVTDRVSQYLVKNVIYDKSREYWDVIFRILFFKLFNKIETWEYIESEIGEISVKSFSVAKFDKLLTNLKTSGVSIYSGAYIMPSGISYFNNKYKHTNHLELLKYIIKNKFPEKIVQCKSMKNAFELLKSIPSFGDFLAFQYVVDINYSEVVNFSEMDFVVAGPGARDGIKKCFSDLAGLNYEEIIKLICDIQVEEFSRLNLPFKNLGGRSLQLIDCQNLFCEIDKYLRVKLPELSGNSGRVRIKQKYTVNNKTI